MNTCHTCVYYYAGQCLKWTCLVAPGDREGCWQPDEMARRDGLAELARQSEELGLYKQP